MRDSIHPLPPRIAPAAARESDAPGFPAELIGGKDRLEGAFNSAIEWPTDERLKIVDQMCKDDAALRNRVRHLLESHEQASENLDQIVSPELQNAFFRPHKAPFGLAALISVVLVAATGIIMWQWERALVANTEFEERKAEVVRENAEYRAMLVRAARSDRLIAEEKLEAGHENEAFAYLARACEFDPLSTLAAERAFVVLNTWQPALPETFLDRNEGEVRSSQFSRDGTRIVIASEDETAPVWTALSPSAGAPPEWFADFLRYCAQMRLNSDGKLETYKPEDWQALRERMRAVRRASVGPDTPYLRILRNYVPE
jgi:hypothetical protein